MRYPYCTINCYDDTEVAHSELHSDNTVTVYFETPDEKCCFKVLTVELPSYKVLESKGYSTFEVDRLMRFCVANAANIIRYATVGGWDNA